MSLGSPGEDHKAHEAARDEAARSRFDASAVRTRLDELLALWNRGEYDDVLGADDLAWQSVAAAGRLSTLGAEAPPPASDRDRLLERALAQCGAFALRNRFATLVRRADELEELEERALTAQPRQAEQAADADERAELAAHVQDLAETWILERDAHEDAVTGLRVWRAHEHEPLRDRFTAVLADLADLDDEVRSSLELLFPAAGLCRAHTAVFDRMSTLPPRWRANRWWWYLPLERIERIEHAHTLDAILPTRFMPVVIVSVSIGPWIERALGTARLAAASETTALPGPITLAERLRGCYETLTLPGGEQLQLRLAIADDGRAVCITVLDREGRPTGCCDGMRATFELPGKPPRTTTIEQAQATFALEPNDYERLAEAHVRIEAPPPSK